MTTHLLSPGTLWQRTLAQTQHGLACGALQSIPTSQTWIEANGIHFLVRIVDNLQRKDAAKKQQENPNPKPFNPFLPYDPDLYVGHLCDTHVCLLNKFNVVDHHLLIVTSQFESQDSLLTAADFEAMWLALREMDGLAFYNGGQVAGASQPHKHLQLVPLPFAPEGPRLPIEPAIAACQPWERSPAGQPLYYSPALPFAHSLVRLQPEWANEPKTAGLTTHQLYTLQRTALGLSPDEPSDAYNLLATRDWMLLVPRQAETFEGISINSLGFAGALLVRNAEQMAQLQTVGPLTVLQRVASAG